jgi:replicative DNA helicase
VLIFSLEMSGQELLERMLAGESEVDSSKIRRGMLEYTDWKSRIHPAAMKIARARIAIDDSAALSILEIRAKARRWAADPEYFPPPEPRRDGPVPGPPLGLIVVDYLQLARGMGGRRDENRQQEIADISRGLKALAKDLRIPVIAVSQLNREVEKREAKRPQLSDLRESGAIEQDADIILFIHRDETPGAEPVDSAKTELIIGKHRNGPTGIVPLTFRRAFTKFESYAEEESYFPA